MVLDDLLIHVLGVGGSDLHLTVGAPPTVRKSGEMQAIEGYPRLTPEQLRQTLYGIMTERQRKRSRRTSSSTSPTPSPDTRASASTCSSSATRSAR